ncbi:unnamed protein product, partial [Meganyctiphanes norvegica]
IYQIACGIKSLSASANPFKALPTNHYGRGSDTISTEPYSLVQICAYGKYGKNYRTYEDFDGPMECINETSQAAAPSNEIIPSSLKCNQQEQQEVHCSGELEQDCTKVHGPGQGILFTLTFTNNRSYVNELNASSSEDSPVATVVFPGVLPGVNYTIQAIPVSLNNIGLKGMNPINTTFFPEGTESSTLSTSVIIGLTTSILLIGLLIAAVFIYIKNIKNK